MKLAIDSLDEIETDALSEFATTRVERILGRLTRRISHASLGLREHLHQGRKPMFVCSMHLHLPGRANVRVESLRTTWQAAVNASLKRAGLEASRRKRIPMLDRSWKPSSLAMTT